MKGSNILINSKTFLFDLLSEYSMYLTLKKIFEIINKKV